MIRITFTSVLSRPHLIHISFWVGEMNLFSPSPLRGSGRKYHTCPPQADVNSAVPRQNRRKRSILLLLEPSNNQGPPPQAQKQQQQQSPSSFSTSTNKTIGSGRIISANKMPEEQQQQQQQQQQKIKPLPMFDTVRNNNNQQLQNNRGNLFGTQNPTGWNPLNSSNIFNNVEQDQKPRLPVFSTLSK